MNDVLIGLAYQLLQRLLYIGFPRFLTFNLAILLALGSAPFAFTWEELDWFRRTSSQQFRSTKASSHFKKQVLGYCKVQVHPNNLAMQWLGRWKYSPKSRSQGELVNQSIGMKIVKLLLIVFLVW